MKTLATLLLPLSISITGCMHSAAEPDEDFGESVRRNMLVQRVNPEAPKSEEPIAYDGHRAGVAQKRYSTDTVEKPQGTGTSKIGKDEE